jgi:rare lipoprotein A
VSNFTKPSILAAITISLSIPLTAFTVEARSPQRGVATWYGPGFAGKRTANGERFNPHAMTAAHRTLPFGTRVAVTNERTGRSVIVRVNDRGPFGRGLVIDLSKSSAQAIGMAGSAPVSLVPLGRTVEN